jgi:amino acid transporter/nucleotide-binding universal stress UspA family protein
VNTEDNRTLGLWGATGVGVGAIVGGGVLALAGVAFSTTGPSAILAFAINGVVAILTALSFAEMSATFPESGGTYTFSKKVLSVQAAFMVGWVVWFASIVAAVLYAMGFAAYAIVGIRKIWEIFQGDAPLPLPEHLLVTVLALLAVGMYTVALARKSTGGGQWATIGKVIVFGIIIIGGLWALARQPFAVNMAKMKPFLPRGTLGLFQAMGYTFIALQGFDIIAAVAGEVRNPGKTLPRSMVLSLGIALAVYLPLLLTVSTVGVGAGSSISALSARNPETVMADAARHFLGPFGYWMVILGAVLAMLSALHANLLAASRVALSMSNDRTLPTLLKGRHSVRGTPIKAILASFMMVFFILLLIPDVASAGAAASLIFLVSFAMAHWTSILARLRAGGRSLPFRVPFFPLVPIAGGSACIALAVFQSISVPSAGLVVGIWLGIGMVLYLTIFAQRARVVDAVYETLDPQLLQLRGRSALVLVPIANPENAETMVAVANALAPPSAGRVLLLFVVRRPEQWAAGTTPQQLRDAQEALKKSLTASFSAGLGPEALTTVAEDPWSEIMRVSRAYSCESMLLGFSNLRADGVGGDLESLISDARSHVVILRAEKGWQLSDVNRVLVPVSGYSTHNRLRARLLNSLTRTRERKITYLQILGENTPEENRKRAERKVRMLREDEIPGEAESEIISSDSPADVIIRKAAENDLIVLGVQKIGRRKVFGEIVLRIAEETDCALIMISQK